MILKFLDFEEINLYSTSIGTRIRDATNSITTYEKWFTSRQKKFQITCIANNSSMRRKFFHSLQYSIPPKKYHECIRSVKIHWGRNILQYTYNIFIHRLLLKMIGFGNISTMVESIDFLKLLKCIFERSLESFHSYDMTNPGTL